MSSEERQRIIRRAGKNEPAEAETADKARESHERASREEPEAEDTPTPDAETPLPEGDDGPLRPRR